MQTGVHQAFYNFHIRFARILALTVSMLAVAVLLRRALDISKLKSVLPHLPTMKFNTALCLLFLGFSLLISKHKRGEASLAMELERLFRNVVCTEMKTEVKPAVIGKKNINAMIVGDQKFSMLAGFLRVFIPRFPVLPNSKSISSSLIDHLKMRSS